ncbi:MAG: alpha/beta hydrolase [Nitrososphaerota archaeon]
MNATLKNYDNAYINSNADMIGYHIEGNSKNVLLFIHGMNAHSGTWRKNIPYFSKEWMTIAPSLTPTSRISQSIVTQYIQTILMMIKPLLSEQISVIGNSLGGVLASLLLMSELPICSLILEDIPDLYDLQPKKLVDYINKKKTPTLLVWGQKDTITPLSIGEKLNKFIIKSKLIVFEDAGHTPHWERSVEFNKTVYDFLKQNNC